MPMLDVSDVILDPLFAQTICVIRRAQSVSSGGIASETDTIYNPIAVVTIGGMDYALEEDLERSRNLITVHSQMPLRGPKTGYEPDFVIWQCNKYIVRKSLNWSQY